MSLMKWTTRDDWDTLRSHMNHWLAASVLSPDADLRGTTQYSPPVDVVETDDQYQVRFVLPDLPECIDEHVHLEATRTSLTLSGELPSRPLASNERRLINQIMSGKFFKQLSFPEHIEHEQIEAHYANGVLTVALPKTVSRQKRNITIQRQS